MKKQLRWVPHRSYRIVHDLLALLRVERDRLRHGAAHVVEHFENARLRVEAKSETLARNKEAVAHCAAHRTSLRENLICFFSSLMRNTTSMS